MFQNSTHLPALQQQTYQPLSSHSADHELNYLDRSQSPSHSSYSAWDTYDAASIRSQASLLSRHDADVPFNSNVQRARKPRLPGLKAFRFTGWRVGVTWCASITTLVLLINTVWTIAASAKYGIKKGLGTMQQGSCDEAKNLSLWLHFGINALSTTLLAASNYCMQCLASPTRDEVDAAHRRRKWLDIGVPSVRNLFYIARRRRVLWLLLAISGVPLHLLYNSAVFSSLTAQDYRVWAASQEVIDAPNLEEILQNSKNPFGKVAYGTLEGAKSWGKMDIVVCTSTYAKQFVTSHGDLVLITPDVNITEAAAPIVGEGTETFSTGGTGYDWMCRGWCSSSNEPIQAAKRGSLEIPYLYDGGSSLSIKSCLSKPAEEHCSVQFSVVIMSIVIVANAVKAFCMFLILQQQRKAPLVTIGDAVQSFLRTNDPETINKCLAERKDFRSSNWHAMIEPRSFQNLKYNYFDPFHPITLTIVAGFAHTSLTFLSCIITLVVTGFLLSMGMSNLNDRSLSHIAHLGFGAITSESLASFINSRRMSRETALFVNIIIANAPQPLLSFLFLTYNSLYTCMLMVEEWYDYAHEGKQLRVTDPTGQQRSTYRLQLPYKYGIPLVVLSGILHWLVSQTIFLVDVEMYRGNEIEADNRVITIGYSCIAIITTIILGSFTILAGILMGFRKYRGGMPLAGSCSAAISAACHQPSSDADAAGKTLLWGVPEDAAKDMASNGSMTNTGVGHCCFTSLPALPPVEGQLYAGKTLQGTAHSKND
ncbi:uncharacterized protein KY384_001166 [Bacidia gigantensis]|uniref:uncharacterized protein n=1 Tax=Bacidia gigantensis TaxID=2732470 RepID=UPI001D0451CC|nr:uncharacterized protein KY384_001166 [Bacidia gigantensis]KAG8534322.1 hypothetical protein KY384_001166 [Bacidia gigantensis]